MPSIPWDHGERPEQELAPVVEIKRAWLPVSDFMNRPRRHHPLPQGLSLEFFRKAHCPRVVLDQIGHTRALETNCRPGLV